VQAHCKGTSSSQEIGSTGPFRFFFFCREKSRFRPSVAFCLLISSGKSSIRRNPDIASLKQKGRVNKHLLWRKLKISSVSSYKYDKHFLGHPSHLHTMAGVWYVFNIHALPLDLVWCLVYHKISNYTTSHLSSQGMTGQGTRNIEQGISCTQSG
jgi:hypothetical protein